MINHEILTVRRPYASRRKKLVEKMGLRGPNAKPPRTKESHDTTLSPAPWANAALSRAERVIAFIETLKITSGFHAGQYIKLRDWQRKIVLGIYESDADGRRKTRQALVTIPRKNGKTQLAAALALAHLVGPETEPRGQIYSAAADRDQAALLYREMIAMLNEAPDLLDRVVIRDFNKHIEDTITGSTYQALSSDARKAHGLNASFVVGDELAQWRGRDLYDNLLTSMGARAEPLMVNISTQSANPHSIMSELVQYGEQILSGAVDDPSFYACIYTAPLDSDPWDEETWKACNPALGDFRSLEEMRTAAAQAQRMPARELSFRLLYLNQAVDADTRFINAADWLACKGPIDLDYLKGKTCFGGLDLGSTRDLTTLQLVFPDGQDGYDVVSFFWVPDDNLQGRSERDRVPYPTWAKDGFIEPTPGRAIDRRFLAIRLGQIASQFDVQSIAYDRWRIEDLKQVLADEGIELRLTEWGQGYKDMGPAVDALEAAVLDVRLCHDSPVLDWNAANAVVTQDPAGARKIAKDKSIERVDGLVALAMAIGLHQREPPPFKSIYSNRGLLSIG